MPYRFHVNAHVDGDHFRDEVPGDGPLGVYHIPRTRIRGQYIHPLLIPSSAHDLIKGGHMLFRLCYGQDEDVIAGRTEVWECWKQAFADLDHVDTTALMDAVWGSCQLAYNNSEKPLVVA